MRKVGQIFREHRITMVTHRAREGQGCLLLRELGIALPGDWGMQQPVQPPPRKFRQLSAGKSLERESCPMRNSSDHAGSHLSTNLTEIYMPLCSYLSGSAMVLSHSAAAVSPGSILHPLHRALSPSSPHWRQPWSCRPRTAGGPTGEARNPPKQHRGLGARREQRERQRCTAFPLQDRAKTRSGGRPWASLIFPFWALAIAKQSPEARPRSREVASPARQSGAAGHAAGRWGCWRQQTWGVSLQ